MSFFLLLLDKQAKWLRQSFQPKGSKKYDLMNPIVTCPNYQAPLRMGGQSNFSDDGGKWLCMNLLKPPCTVFSLGSNGDFTFEESILNSTQCLIHTFDCTFNGSSIDKRHTYHEKCLGSAERAQTDERFTTLAAAAAGVGVVKINLLKIDVEGYEYDVLSSWSQGDASLPEQIAIEVHHSDVIYNSEGSPGSKDNAKDFSNLLCESRTHA